MHVRALRITVLKSAGNFTRDECHDLNAEKISTSNVLCSRGAEFVAGSNFRTPARPAGFENFRQWSIGGNGSLLRDARSTPASFGFSCDRSKLRDFPAIAGRLFKLGLRQKVARKIKRIGDHRRDHGARDDGCDER
jgi:hypothetical protein